MFEALRCATKGHIFVDSRSQPGTQVCLRCRQRQLFEGLVNTPKRPDRRQPLSARSVDRP